MIFDGHSDIFSDVRYKREAGETQVLKNHHLDRLRKGGIGGACFVIWADTYNGHAPKDEMEAIVKGIKGEMAETKEFVLTHNVEELKAAEAGHLRAAGHRGRHLGRCGRAPDRRGSHRG